MFNVRQRDLGSLASTAAHQFRSLKWILYILNPHICVFNAKSSLLRTFPRGSPDALGNSRLTRLRDPFLRYRSPDGLRLNLVEQPAAGLVDSISAVRFWEPQPAKCGGLSPDVGQGPSYNEGPIEALGEFRLADRSRVLAPVTVWGTRLLGVDCSVSFLPE